jgi:hypothetical protein
VKSSISWGEITLSGENAAYFISQLSARKQWRFPKELIEDTVPAWTELKEASGDKEPGAGTVVPRPRRV